MHLVGFIIRIRLCFVAALVVVIINLSSSVQPYKDAAVYCTVLCCAVLYRTVPYHTVLYRTVLYMSLFSILCIFLCHHFSGAQ